MIQLPLVVLKIYTHHALLAYHRAKTLCVLDSLLNSSVRLEFHIIFSLKGKHNSLGTWMYVSYEIGIKRRNYVDSAQDRGYCRSLVNTSLNLQVP